MLYFLLRVAILTYLYGCAANVNHQVVPGMKELRATAIEGQNIQVDKYRPLRANGETEYDETTGADR